MYNLHVDSSWAKQIEIIRNAHTDSTNIQRADKNNYRTCRNSTAVITVHLHASSASKTEHLNLSIMERDFYVFDLGGHKMERYSSKIKTDNSSAKKFQVSAWRLNSAIHDLCGNHSPEREFENVTLLTFCVAESLRSDALAIEISSTIQNSRQMSIQNWVQLVRDWSETSALIRQGQPVPQHLRHYAAGIKTLCL
jgi:hypothetical protein